MMPHQGEDASAGPILRTRVIKVGPCSPRSRPGQLVASHSRSLDYMILDSLRPGLVVLIRCSRARPQANRCPRAAASRRLRANKAMQVSLSDSHLVLSGSKCFSFVPRI